MLMKPLIGRHDDAAGLPVDALPWLPLRPEKRVALAAEDDHVGAGAMLMTFFVGSYRKLRDMRAHGLLGQIELHIRAALAALAVIGEADAARIRHEVRGHEEAAGDFALTAEVAFRGRIKAIKKRIVVVENEIDVVERILHAARVGE